MPAEQRVSVGSEHASVRRSGHLVFRRSLRRRGINTQRERVYTYTPAWLALPLLFSFSPPPPVSSSAPFRLSWWKRDRGWTINELLRPTGNYSSWSMAHRKRLENTHMWIHNCHTEKRGPHLVFVVQASPFKSSWEWIVRRELCSHFHIKRPIYLFTSHKEQTKSAFLCTLLIMDSGIYICILANPETLKMGRFMRIGIGGTVMIQFQLNI